MDRKKLSALAGLALLSAGAWWWFRQQKTATAEGAAASGALDLSFLDSIDAQLAPAVSNLQTTVSNAVDDLMNAIRPGPWSPPASAAPYLDAIAAAEAQYGLPQNLLARLLYQESHFRADIISGAQRSSAGAVGIAQFMPATAADLGIDPTDPFASIDAAARYLAQLYAQTGGNDWKLALAAYNWGIGNVQRKGIAAAPAETQSYVAGIAGDVGIA